MGTDSGILPNRHGDRAGGDEGAGIVATTAPISNYGRSSSSLRRQGTAFASQRATEVANCQFGQASAGSNSANRAAQSLLIAKASHVAAAICPAA